MTSYSGPYNSTFLHQQIKALLKFYDPVCRDDNLGGFFNQLRDDGTVYDRTTKHAVGTCRFTVNYSIAALLYGKTCSATKTNIESRYGSAAKTFYVKTLFNFTEFAHLQFVLCIL